MASVAATNSAWEALAGSVSGTNPPPAFCSLRMSCTASGTCSVLPRARRSPMSSSTKAAAAEAQASTWLARSDVLPMSSASVRRPSIQPRPRPYQIAYSKKICPWKRRRLT